MSEKLEKERKVQVRAVLSFVIIMGILGITGLGLTLLVLNKRKAKEEEKERVVPAVEVVTVSIEDHRVEIVTQGVVESARETRLAAEVGGRVMEVSPNLKRGGTVEEGERLAQIDPSDYRTALAAAEVALEEAELALEQERAKVEQAKLDWEKLGSGNPVNPLVLRGPYLAAAEARAASAREDAARARRDLERTEIIAPFDAGVRIADVEEGAVVARGTTVAELYTSEELEVRLPLGLEDFGFLKRDGNGNVTGGVVLRGTIGATGYEWTGTLARVDPEIDRETLSAAVVVRVAETEGSVFPYPPVGLFVDAELEGKVLDDVAEIPRRALLEGDRVIVVEGEDKIDFRDVEVLRLNKGTVVVGEGLEASDRVVLTRLSMPVVGMEVEIEEAAETGEEK